MASSLIQGVLRTTRLVSSEVRVPVIRSPFRKMSVTVSAPQTGRTSSANKSSAPTHKNRLRFGGFNLIGPWRRHRLIGLNSANPTRNENEAVLLLSQTHGLTGNK